MSPRPIEGGFALLIVLWSMALMALLLTQVTAAGRSDAQLAGNLRRAASVQAAADGAVHEAIFHLLDPAPAARWAADGVSRALPPPPGMASATVVVEDEAGRANPNTAPVEFLAALVRAAGATADRAGAIAAEIVDWRAPSGEPPATGPKAQRYRRAGMAFGPLSDRFQSIDEIGLVMGMTPALLAALRPALTLDSDGTVDPRVAVPLVLRAFQLAGIPTTATGPLSPPSAVRITARVLGGDGSGFTRRATVSLGRDGSGRLFRITGWDSPAL